MRPGYDIATMCDQDMIVWPRYVGNRVEGPQYRGSINAEPAKKGNQKVKPMEIERDLISDQWERTYDVGNLGSCVKTSRKIFFLYVRIH